VNIIQNNTQVFRHSLTKGLLVTLGIAVGIEISGIIHQNYLKIFSLEYALVFFGCFLLAAFATWITTSRKYQVKLDDMGMQIISEETSRSFRWDEVKTLHRPNFLRDWWTFTLKQGGKVKLMVAGVDKSQRIALAREINNRFTLR
jgi:hypothetical protein